MADQKRWFKLWESALSDSALNALSPAMRWAWAALGAHTKVHGENGVVRISVHNAVLAAGMGVELSSIKDVIKQLPHIDVEEGQNRNGEFTVTWNRWSFYQEDSTVTERQKKWRERKRNGLRGEERRREEKREKEPSLVSLKNGIKNDNGFEAFWEVYPRKVGRVECLRIWKRLGLKSDEVQKAIAGVLRDRQSEQWMAGGVRFVPHPSTWLNQRRWEDQVEEGRWGLPPRAAVREMEERDEADHGGRDPQVSGT